MYWMVKSILTTTHVSGVTQAVDVAVDSGGVVVFFRNDVKVTKRDEHIHG